MEVYDSKLYMVKGNLLRRANLDGSGLQNVYVMPAGNTLGFHFDDTGRLYYSNNDTKSVYRDNLAGTALELLHAVGTNVSMGAVETLNSQLYWVQGEEIYRSGLDGTGASSLGISNVAFSGNTGDNLELDGVSGKMYWISSDGIYSGGLDGSNAQLIYASNDVRSLELGPLPSGSGGGIPEPATLAVWSLLGIGLVARRRGRKAA